MGLGLVWCYGQGKFRVRIRVGLFQDKPELFSKKIIACSVKYCFPMCSGMFEVYKNRNILQFAQFFVSQSHLEDDGSDAPRLLHWWHFFVRH